MDRNLAYCRLRDNDSGLPHIQDIRISNLYSSTASAACDDIRGTRHQRITFMACVRPGESAAGRIRQICHRPRSRKALRLLQLLAECQDKQLFPRSNHHLSAGDSHSVPERNRIGSCLSFIHIRSVPGGNERNGALFGAMRGDVLRRGRQIRHPSRAWNPDGRIYSVPAHIADLRSDAAFLLQGYNHRAM